MAPWKWWASLDSAAVQRAALTRQMRHVAAQATCLIAAASVKRCAKSELCHRASLRGSVAGVAYPTAKPGRVGQAATSVTRSGLTCTLPENKMNFFRGLYYIWFHGVSKTRPTCLVLVTARMIYVGPPSLSLIQTICKLSLNFIV